MSVKLNASTTSPKAIHWSDITADRIIKQVGDKEEYTLASGITPSGTVHFGNFRETITVNLVARALREKGKKVREIFSWDDYDTFRKVPKNMPMQEKLHEFMYQPIVDTPDPYGKEESYAAHQEKKYEAQLERVGIKLNALYQAKKYRNSEYVDQIKIALKAKDEIVEILNKHRSAPLAANWMPVSVYCQQCNRDKEIENIAFDGEQLINYECKLCGFKGSENLATTTRIKLPWRLDWPMRWVYEGVDFEPGGKDHSSEGGSFTTAKELVSKVFKGQAPVYLQYDFVSIKGGGGKMSSSSGEVVTVNDVLDVYEPEMIRWIFASYKTNVDFSVSFDLDVIKMYEDFDRLERLAYGVDAGNAKKVAMAKRVYELSQLNASDMPEQMPFQPSFRHLCNILQINNGDISKATSFYAGQMHNDRDERRFTQRAQRALFWLNNYAPEEFKFKLNGEAVNLTLSESQKSFVKKLSSYLETSWEEIETDKQLHQKMYEFINEDSELTPQVAFETLYQLLISKQKGPKLAGFIRIIGKERTCRLMGLCAQ